MARKARFPSQQGHAPLGHRSELRGFENADGTPAGELVLHVAELEFLSAKPKEEELPLETTAV
jgi:hypothetical protein